MAKLSNADRNRILARSLFVDAKKSTEEISETLEVTTKTIDNYRSKDKSLGYDWLTLRASKDIQSSQEKNENMFSMFTQYMMESLKEIRENEEFTPEKKTQMIVSLGDSFSKMRKIAASEDPEAYKLGLIKHVVQNILVALKDVLDEKSMTRAIDKIYEIQEDLIDVSV